MYELEAAQKDVPPPASYEAKHKLTEAARNKGFGFGSGMRDDPMQVVAHQRPLSAQSSTSPMLINVKESYFRMLPGPGQYRPPSAFDKHARFDPVARKLLQKLQMP